MASLRREVLQRGNSLLDGRDASRTNRPLFCRAFVDDCLRLPAQLIERTETPCLSRHGAVMLPMANFELERESSRIWGTVATSVQACELTDAATQFDLDTEISVFLHPRSGHDPPLAQILFAPLLVHGACLPVLEPRQRMASCARPPMTKITGVAGLEGFLVEQCKVPVYSLSVQCVGDSTVLPFHRYSV